MINVVQALRRGTKAHTALLKLHSIAGKATRGEWMVALKWKFSTAAFNEEVLFLLENQSLIFCRDSVYTITDAGCALIGIVPDAPGGLPPLPAASRDAPIMRPLSRRHMPRMDLAREGSLDYRDIPSRIGDKLISHRKA